MTVKDLSILIADDNEMNRWLLVEQLAYWSEDITVAGDGREAWGLLQKQPFALVFLDVNMPGYTGFELVKMARAESSNQQSVIVAITAHVQNHQKHLLLEEGFNDCLIKPIVLADLQRVISQWRPSGSAVDSHYYANAVLEKVQRNPALARMFLQKLFQDVPTQFASLEHALRNQSRQEALNIAHKLHGSFCFYGFADFRAIAERLEQHLLDANMAEGWRQFQLLSAKFDALLAMQPDVFSHMDS